MNRHGTTVNYGMMLITALPGFGVAVGERRVRRQHGVEEESMCCQVQITLDNQ